MNKILVTTTSLLAGAALVLGGAVSANAATPDPSSSGSGTTSSTCTFGQHLVSSWLEVPKALRDDLKTAKADGPGAARRAELKKIRATALDGGYGSAVEKKAKYLKTHRGEATGIRPLPDNLKADLKTLKGESSKADKLKEANVIADKAIAGDYGTKIEALAKKLESSPAWQNCTPATKGSSSGS